MSDVEGMRVLVVDDHDVVQWGFRLLLGEQRWVDQCLAASTAEEAIADMRTAISRPLTPPSLDTGATLHEELERLGRHYRHLPLEVEWEPGAEVPESLEPLTQAVLAEALRNCEKHAQATRVTVRIAEERGTFTLEVRNDGAVAPSNGAKGARMGLRLAALEAIQSGGMVEFGPVGRDEWRVRLVLPLEAVEQ
jgi:signal transduction histidine kinase